MTELPPPIASAPPPPLGLSSPPERPQSATPHNWQGIVAAILGLLGSPLFGILFGIMGLRSVKAGTANNRGLALTGIIAGGLWAIVGVIGVIGVAALNWGAPTGTQFTAAEDLVVGDCFAKHGDAEKEGEAFTVVGLYTMDCELSHYGEVYYLGTMTNPAYPGSEEAADIAETGCFSEAAARSVDLDKVGDADAFFLFPLEDSWARGDRIYVCMVVSEAEDLVGSILLTD